MPKLKVAGLFAGVGGIEEGLRSAGHEPVFLCEKDESAKRVLAKQFPDVELHGDILELSGKDLPACDVLAAGFPCQDLSPAGRTAGIEATNSGLVRHVFRLIEEMSKPPTWVLLENVPFMLQLHKGKAMDLVTSMLEQHGYRWAYRTIDTRAFGLPQRRRRVIVLASKSEDPARMILTHGVAEQDQPKTKSTACGFYWTEGNTGLGWAVDAVPALKRGSGLRIASPPGIWLPRKGIVTPHISDAERLQGFPSGWTEQAANGEVRGEAARWSLVGNAVSVPVAAWVGERLATETVSDDRAPSTEWTSGTSWPAAGRGEKGKKYSAKDASSWPVEYAYQHLGPFLKSPAKPLSLKATKGFLGRLEKSSLHRDAGFVAALRAHIEALEA